MKMKPVAVVVASWCVICLLFAFPGIGGAGEYPSLSGLKSIKAVFDFRDGNPETALIHLKLVQMVLEDKAVRKVTSKPELAVVFMDKSVTLLSKNREDFTPKEAKNLDDLVSLVSELNKQGVRLEICGVALDYFKVDPKSVPSVLHHVENGWISTIGYQAKGYSLVPAF
jgi:intracellular sulfur oxidation DsrE/DsrF family protein